MPDVTYSLSVNVSKNALQQNLFVSQRTFDMSTVGLLSVTLNLGTTTTLINTASASSLGFCLAQSLVTDATGTTVVSFGRISGTTLFDAVRLRPGDSSWLRLAPGNYAASASAPNSRLLLQILED
jgi:hypothetical protein